DAEADLDLYLQESETDDPVRGAVRSSHDPEGTERIFIARGDQKPLRTGAYYAYVIWPADRHDEPPQSSNGEALDAVPFRLRLFEIKTHVDAVLEPGVPLHARMTAAAGSFRTYAVDVPGGAPCLRVDVSDAPQALTLRLRAGKPMVGPDDADAVSRLPFGTQWLVVKPQSSPPLRAGRYYIDVVDESQLDSSFPFTIRASFRPDPDPSLLVLPRAPAPKTALEAALRATVEVIGDDGGGSGVIVGDRGFILTNYHVVQDVVEGRGEIGSPLVIALPVDPRDPPHEAFHARVVTSSADLDLALLGVTDTLYGRPVPPDFRFPTATLGDPATLTIGDTIYAAGYPGAGGSGSRVSVTVTRGILAGWERRGDTLHIKTDATINSGNSGGAALDARFEVIGQPTETIPDADERGRG
ncbi:MAG: S1C family serine protease, partial [Polyangiaceae bacterium]